MNHAEIKILVIRAGIAQISIAKKVGVSDPYINQVIKGVHKSNHVREAIANAVRKPVEKLWPNHI